MRTKTMNAATADVRMRVRLLLGGTVMAVAATWATTSWSQPMGHGMNHGRGGETMMGGSPEHMSRMMDHMLVGLDATEAQRSQIKQIAEAAATDLKAQREAGRGLRQHGMELFTMPNVDANAAEALRQQMLQQHDQASRRMMLAMLDISRVLTPEQKAKIAQRMKERAARMQERSDRVHREQPKSQ